MLQGLDRTHPLAQDLGDLFEGQVGGDVERETARWSGGNDWSIESAHSEPTLASASRSTSPAGTESTSGASATVFGRR